MEAMASAVRRPATSALAAMNPPRLMPDLSSGAVSRPFTSSSAMRAPLQGRDVLPQDPRLGRAVGLWEDLKPGPVPDDPKLREALAPLHEEANGGLGSTVEPSWHKTMPGLGNSVWNPRARPMTEETQREHDRDYERMHAHLKASHTGTDEELHAKVDHQLSTAEIGSVKPGSRLSPGETIVGAHQADRSDAGQFAVRQLNAHRDLVNDVALAWDGGKGADQHKGRSTYEGTGDGAPYIESVAAAKNHRTDGRLLPGGLSQMFLEKGMWPDPDHASKGLKKLGTEIKL